MAASPFRAALRGQPAHALQQTPRRLPALALSALCIAAGAAAASAQEAPQVALDWKLGPMTAPIGDDLAEVEIGEAYVYLDAEDTQRFLELNENPISGRELATVAPRSDAQNWFLIFEFDRSGYVRDDERDSLDPDAMLASIREGTEAGNELRRKRGWAEMKIVGWQEAPHYEAQTQNLSWAIIGESAGHRNINRLTKLLGRRGVMTATLVANPEELASASAAADQLLGQYRYRPGNTYAEYVPGTDKLAEYGLTALIVGGAGAALLKSGLLARLWKPIAIGLVALLGGLKRALFGGRRSEDHDMDKPIG